MPTKCSVPFCNSNYKGSKEYTSIFTFPSNINRRRLWLYQIRRKNFIPGKASGVCIKHFEDRFILRDYRVRKVDGSFLIVPRKTLALSKDAYPTIFDFKEINHESSESESDHDIEVESEENSDSYMDDDDRINDIIDFKQHFQTKLPDSWVTLPSEDNIYIAKMNVEPFPELLVSIKINADLSFNVWYKSAPVPSETFDWLFGSKLHLDSWARFECLIQHLNENNNIISIDMQLKGISNMLEDCARKCKDQKMLTKLFIISEHVKLVSSVKPVPQHGSNNSELGSRPKARKTISRVENNISD